MKKFIVTLYFGAKTSGGPFGDMADTVKIEMKEEDKEAVIHRLIGNPWNSINTAKGLKVVNTTKILWFDIEEVQE